MCGQQRKHWAPTQTALWPQARLGLLKVRTLAIDRFFEEEPLLWETLKSTRYYHDLRQCMDVGRSLPFISWLRFMLQVPSTITVQDLFSIFEEEDTMTILTTVRPSSLTAASTNTPGH